MNSVLLFPFLLWDKIILNNFLSSYVLKIMELRTPVEKTKWDSQDIPSSLSEIFPKVAILDQGIMSL